MATNAYLTYHDGKLEIPEELQQELKLREGARLRVVYSAPSQIIIKPEIEQSEQPVGDWRLLRGVLADTPVDFNAELEADRIRENELDAR